MAWTSNKDSAGALGYPAELVTNNPEKYGIIFSDDVSGHRQVKDLTSLYEIPTAILSKSKTTDHSDAVGQKWFVQSEGKHYRLINWDNRAKAAGWVVDTQAIDRITGVNYTISTPSATTTTRNIKITGLNPQTNAEVSSNVNLPEATETAAGVMSSVDKSISKNLQLLGNVTHLDDNNLWTRSTNEVKLNYTCVETNGNKSTELSTTHHTVAFGEATEALAGCMSATDKNVINNLIKLANVSHIDDTNTWTRSATNVTLNYTCKETNGKGGSTADPNPHHQAIGAATTDLAGIMVATDKITVNDLRTISAVSHMDDDELFTATADGMTINYKCISTVSKDAITLTRNIDVPLATTTAAGIITSTDKIMLNNLKKLSSVTHLKHDDALFTTTADAVTIHYDCMAMGTKDAGITTRQKALPAASLTNAGTMSATDKNAVSQLLKLGSVSHINDNSTFTTTASTIKFNYTCIDTSQKDVDKLAHAIDFPIATTTAAGAITATEKLKLNTLTYVSANTDSLNNTAGISQIKFAGASSDTAYVKVDYSKTDNTKFIVEINDNFGLNDTNDLFQVRGHMLRTGNDEQALQPEENVRFQVGKTIQAVHPTTNVLERVLSTTDIVPLNNIGKLVNVSHINDENTFTASATDVKLNYQCVGLVSGTLSTHTGIIPAVTTTKAGVMTAEDKVNFDELCLLTYGNNTALTMGGSTQTIEKGVNNSVTVTWNVTFNGTAITPATVSVKKGTTELSTSTTTKSLTDTLTDSATYTTTITYRGVTKTASRSYNAYYPKYYGGNAATSLTSANITALTKQAISSTASGTYNVTCAENQYIWFCVPSTMTINKITMGGFSFPILAAVTVAVTGKGNYKCYRSENLMSAGTRSFVIS